MSVALHGDIIRLASPVRIEDAETLVSLMLAGRGRAVDVTGAGPLHAAVAQALLAFRPPIIGPNSDPFTQTWLLPLLDGLKPL